MTTKDEVIKHILEDTFYEDILKKYLKNTNERNEFRQELWLILLEMNELKLIDYYDRKVLKYIYIGIIDNQIKSKTSPWHLKFRNIVLEYIPELHYTNEDNVDDILIKNKTEYKLNFINTFLIKLEKDKPQLIRDITIFKMSYLENLSYRKIQDKTNIGLSRTSKYVNNILNLIKEEYNTNKIKITKELEYNDYNDN